MIGGFSVGAKNCKIATMNYSESRERIMSGLSSVKIAGLWKRSQCLHRYTKPNYRHRVFILTDQSLSYYSGTLDVSFKCNCKLIMKF